MKFPTIDVHSAFYKNCKRQRKVEAKICQSCPFRKGIEAQEKDNDDSNYGGVFAQSQGRDDS